MAGSLYRKDVMTVIYPMPLEVRPYARKRYIHLVRGFLNAREIERIHEERDRAPMRRQAASGSTGRAPRHSGPARYLVRVERSEWLYQRVAELLFQVNRRHFDFDIAGFVEPMRVLRYRPGTRMSMHSDYGVLDRSKLSLVVQLNAASEFDGGELRFTDFGPKKLDRGDAVVYPGYVTHGVTELTAGERVSLAAWVAGPRMR